MKTALLIALATALVFAAVLAQFRARQAENQAALARAAEQRVREIPVQPPVALQKPEAAPGGGSRPAVEISDSGTLKITSPEATLELPPPLEPKAAAPAPVTRGKAPALAQNRGQSGTAPGGLPSVKAASGAPNQGSAGVSAAQTPAQMLLQSEIKVMRRHYENVLQRALEAEEKSHVATTDPNGNAKAQPDADASSHQDRAAVLRRYAEQLQNAITAKASELASQEATTVREYAPVPESTASVRGNGSDTRAENRKALKEYPKLGIGNVPTTTPPQINGYAGESSNRKAVLDAQVRAQRAALNAEKIGLDEAMDDLKRAEPAYEQKVISAEELSHKQYAVKKAQARLEKLEAELAATEAERAMSKAQLQRTLPSAEPVSPAGIPGGAGGIAPNAPATGNPGTLPPATPANPPVPALPNPGGR